PLGQNMQDPLRFLERQAFEKQIVDQRKDRRVEADPERERDDGDERERRRLPKFAKCETEIVHLSCRQGFYSVRKACTGSTSVARRAGNKHASSAIAASKTVAPPSSTGLWADTSKSCDATNRPSANPATTPIASPITTGLIP